MSRPRLLPLLLLSALLLSALLPPGAVRAAEAGAPAVPGAAQGPAQGPAPQDASRQAAPQKPEANTAQPVLRPTSTVDSDMIRLGDLFANAGSQAGIVVAAAPGPGQRTIFDARWLYSVAIANKLNWRPITPYDRAVVTRATKVIGVREVSAAILQALRPQLTGQDAQVELANSDIQLLVPANQGQELRIENLNYNHRSGQFLGVAVAGEGQDSARARIWGRITTMTPLPVLVRPLSTKDIIAAQDVTMIDVPTDRIQPDQITDPAALIGMSARHPLQPGVGLRSFDIAPPVLVTKNSLVLMVVKEPFMRLTAQGKALESGGRGDTVRVQNIQTKNIVEAVVTGPGEVMALSNSATVR